MVRGAQRLENSQWALSGYQPRPAQAHRHRGGNRPARMARRL